MSYYTGTANDLTALRQALIDACTAESWSWDAINQVLYYDGIFVELTVSGTNFSIKGRTDLTSGQGPYYARIGNCVDSISWPVTYRIHIFENEVYLLINYNVSSWQWMAFGKSSVLGIVGSGNWYGASWHDSALSTSNTINLQEGSGGASSPYYECPGLFWRTYSSGNRDNCFINHGFDSYPWTCIGSNASFRIGINSLSPLIGLIPNAWNSEALLLPIRSYIQRASSKIVLVSSFNNSRITRIDNYSDAQIVDIGSDRWCVYPWFKKNSSARDNLGASTHTGTFGWAIRYDGA